MHHPHRIRWRTGRTVLTFVLMTTLLTVVLAPGSTAARPASPPFNNATRFEPGCATFGAVEEWSGTISFSYAQSASSGDESVSTNESGNVTVEYERNYVNGPNYGWVGRSASGNANLDYAYTTDNSSETVRGNGQVRQPGRTQDEAYTSVGFNSDTCTFQFYLHAQVDATLVLTYGSQTSTATGYATAGIAHVEDIPLTGAGTTIAGSRDVPAYWLVEGRDDIEDFYSGHTGRLESMRGFGNIGTATVTWSFTPLSWAGEPQLGLDAELLERSIFLDQVPVDDRFDANVDWREAGEGYVSWQLGPQPVERVGATGNTTIPKTVDVGEQGVGTRPLVAQAHNIYGQNSEPMTVQITVAPLMEWCGTDGNITAEKLGAAVSYRCGFKLPEPAFEADVDTHPRFPFFRGKKLGIRETQISADLEVKSTGEGTLKANGQTGFQAMGGAIIVGAAGKADLLLVPEGLTIPTGALELTIGGKLSKEEPLIAVVPVLDAGLALLAEVWPEAAIEVYMRANAGLELELKGTPTFNFRTNNNQIEWTTVEGTASLGARGTAQIQIIEGRVEVGAYIGGDGSVSFVGSPEPGFKQAEVKFLAGYKLMFLHFANEGEKSWTWSSASAAEPGEFVEGIDTGIAAAGEWRIMDRAYLVAPDYARWTGDEVARRGPTDQQLVQNVFPQAHPTLVTRDGTDLEYLIWSHDKPGSPALSGQELAFARGYAANWGSTGGAKLLTNDDRADLNPQMVLLPNGRMLVVWERFDSATPGDLNTDGAAYLSHLQVAGGIFAPNLAAPTIEPLQLSESGSLSHRPQVVPISGGALATWIDNPDNQIMGSAASPDTLMWRRYNSSTNSWSAAAAVAPPIAGLIDYDLAAAGANAALVYSKDMDGNFATDGDRELFYTRFDGTTWTAPTRLTSNGVVDGAPQIELKDDGTPLLLWQQGTGFRLLAGSWSGTPTALPFDRAEGQANWQVTRGRDGSLALVWEELDQGDNRIGFSIYDGVSGGWSDPAAVVPPVGDHTTTGTTAMVSHVSPRLVTDRDGRESLALGYQLAAVEPVTRTVEGRTIPNTPRIGAQNLRLAHVPLGPNLSVAPDDLSATPATARAGDPVTIKAVIHNSGSRATTGGTVELLRRTLDRYPDDTVVATLPLGALRSGEQTTLTFTTSRPALADHRYVVRVTSAEGVVETNLDDNEAALGAELALVTLPTSYDAPGGGAVEARLDIRGAIPPAGVVSATLTLDDVDGPQVGEALISFPVTPTDSLAVTSWLDATELGPGRHQVYWNVDPALTLGEAEREDNVVGTSVHILPDLTTRADMVSFGDEPGGSAPFRMLLRNEGSWASSAGTVEIFDGLPGQPGVQSLGRLALPAVEAGKVALIEGELTLTGTTAATTGLRAIYIRIDPEQKIDELNENNNLIRVGEMLGPPLPDTQPKTVYLPLVRR